MKKLKMTVAVLLIAAMCIGAVPAQAAESTGTNYLVAESFNGVATNGTPDSLTVTSGRVRVVETSKTNKALELMRGDKTVITAPFETTARQYVVSLYLSGASQVNADITLAAGKDAVNLLTIRDGMILTQEGKHIGGTRVGAFTRIAITIDRKLGVFSVYINDKKELDWWKLPANSGFTGLTVTRNKAMEESLYMDNLYIYEGNRPVRALPQDAFNPDGEEFLDMVDDLGDFSFFKSNYITHRYVAYPNTTLYPKTNEIICEKFDYKNAEKGDRIIFKKTTQDDCYIDIAGKIFNTYKSSKEYKYFKLTGDFMCDFEGESSVYIYQLRDNTSGASQVNLYPITINSDGSIKLLDNQIIQGAAAKGKWFNVQMYLNLEAHTIDMFLDGEQVLKSAPLSEKLLSLNTVRVQCRTGSFTGEMQARNMEFTGLDKPYTNEGGEVWTSMFDDDSAIADYLADKTCFHFYAQNMYTGGSKQDLTTPSVYEEGELYVSLADFNTAYGVTATLNGAILTAGDKSVTLEKVPKTAEGVTLLPVMEAAQKLLDRYVFDDTNGLVITAEEELYFDLDKEVPYDRRKIETGYVERFSPLQYIYDYILFDRPTREQLYEGFNAATDNGTQHPRLLATAEDFARIREQIKTDSYMQKVHEGLIKKADGYCKADPIVYRYDDALRTMSSGANRLRERMIAVGYAYHMTGDQKYVDCAWKNMEALNRFPDMNPGHPIDTGSYGEGLAIGYDWFYHALTPEQRENIEYNAKRLHMTVINEGFYGRSPVRGGNDGNLNVIGLYNKWISNYNTWVNSGSLMMSLAFMETYPELCTDLLWHSIRSFEYTLKNFYPDGAWGESSNYWSAVARCLTLTYGSLGKIYGEDFNLSIFPGLEETGITNMSLRSMQGSYNYHDAPVNTEYADFNMTFIGSYFNQPEVMAARYATLLQSFDDRMPTVEPEVFDILYYDPSVKVEEIAKLPKVKVTGGLDLFTVHEDYTDYDGLFLAAHGGPVTFYHSHNDNGDFVFDLNGVRWATSLPAENYNSSLGSNQKYRMRTEGHNTVTINNDTTFNQLADTFAPIIRAEEGEGGAYAVYDMADMYRNTDSFLRGFYVDDNFRTVTIRDEIDVSKEKSEIYWFMHTEAEAQVIDEKTIVLSKDGESLAVNIETEADETEIDIMDAVPLPSSPEGKGQNPNAGVRKIAIKVITDDKATITVRLSEIAGEVNTTPIAQWIAPAKSEAEQIRGRYGYRLMMNGTEIKDAAYIPVLDAKTLPAFEILPEAEGMHVEVTQAEDLTGANIIRVYNPERTKQKIYILPYSESLGIKEIAYNELEIADYSVSSEPEAANIGPNMFDNDFSTRWTTLKTDETAIFDLGSVQTVDGMAAGFWQSGARQYSFELEGSTDGVSWTPIGSFTSVNGPEDFQVFKFTGTTARYIRYTGKGNTTNVNSNLLEFRLLKLKEGF